MNYDGVRVLGLRPDRLETGREPDDHAAMVIRHIVVVCCVLTVGWWPRLAAAVDAGVVAAPARDAGVVAGAVHAVMDAGALDAAPSVAVDAGVADAQAAIASPDAGVFAGNSGSSAPPGEPPSRDGFWLVVLRQALGTVLGGLLLLTLPYLLVQSYQKDAERQKLLHELTKEFERITSSPCVTKAHQGFEVCETWKLTVALTRKVLWVPRKTEPDHRYWKGDRWIAVSEDQTVLISALSLHEALFWFHRIDRAQRRRLFGPLLRPRDVHQLWRQALPFVTDGRYDFCKWYFGDDSESIARVCFAILAHCKHLKSSAAVDYLKLKASTPEDDKTNKMRVDPSLLRDLDEKADRNSEIGWRPWPRPNFLSPRPAWRSHCALRTLMAEVERAGRRRRRGWLPHTARAMAPLLTQGRSAEATSRRHARAL